MLAMHYFTESSAAAADMHILSKMTWMLCIVGPLTTSVVIMAFNPSKCEFLQFTKKIHPACKMHINNVSIKQVTNAMYLGVTIDKNLTRLSIQEQGELPGLSSRFP